jgi:DNA replication protein DnaC
LVAGGTVRTADGPRQKTRCYRRAEQFSAGALAECGTGKTHIALALGISACQQGVRVRFTSTAALVHELLEARDGKRLLRYQRLLLRQEMLIVDELAFVPLSKTGAEMLFEVFSQRDTNEALRWLPAISHSPSGLTFSAPSV